jgi:hypothetical protein
VSVVVQRPRDAAQALGFSPQSRSGVNLGPVEDPDDDSDSLFTFG